MLMLFAPVVVTALHFTASSLKRLRAATEVENNSTARLMIMPTAGELVTIATSEVAADIRGAFMRSVDRAADAGVLIQKGVIR